MTLRQMPLRQMPLSPIPAAALFCLAALAGPAPGSAAAAAERAVFDFYVSGLRVGEVRLDADTAPGRYEASSRIETAGLVGMLADYFFDGTARGSLADGGGIVPELYEARSRSPRADRRTRVTWKGGTPVSVSVDPPRSSAPKPEQQAGTVDPISAGFKLLRSQPRERICNSVTDVFDGSRRYRLVLGAPGAAGDDIACDGRFSRTEGEAHTMSDAKEAPFRIVFAADAGGTARVRRIETSTRFGPAVVERRD